MSLARALALLVLVFIASGHPTVLVDPVIVEDGLDYVKSTTTPDKPESLYADMRVDSSRKEIIHAEKETTPETSATKPDFAIAKRRLDRYVIWEDTHISLINATPYRWQMTYNSSYRLLEWDLKWPPSIYPGQSVTLRVNNLPHHLLPSKDAFGEVTYELKGTRKPASFQVQYRSGLQHRVFVQFQDQLKTLNNEVNSVNYLGIRHIPGGVGFMIAGREGEFISNDGPKQWMQSQLAEIGDMPLRSIALIRSHNSGMWLPSHRIGFGEAENSLTQTRSIYEQLSIGGVRVIDYHPLMGKDKRFHAGTGAWLGPRYHGMKGPGLRAIIDQFNRFMYEYPGELFIWDLYYDDARDANRHYKMLNDDNLRKLVEELKVIKHRANLEDLHDQDITFRRLKDFISPEHKEQGRSTVIIRVPFMWARTPYFSAKEGFISEDNFPLNSHRPKTNDIKTLIKGQFAALKEARPSRMTTMYNMDWRVTMPSFGLFGAVPSLLAWNLAAWPALFNQFWYGLSDTTYPNMVTMDNIQGSSLKAMVMTINKCFVARRCGRLGGLVNLPEGME